MFVWMYQYCYKWEQRGEVWRNVTMVAKFLDDNKGEFMQRRWLQQREWQKSNRFRLVKQQVCTCIRRFFLYI